MRNISLVFEIAWNLTEINVNSYFSVNSIAFDGWEARRKLTYLQFVRKRPAGIDHN